MKLKKFIQSDYGKLMISIILGFGLATLFRKSCSDKKCMKFKGPELKDIKENTYEYEDKCYQFQPKSVVCNSKKRIVKFA
jgi:hypothetical protein